MAQSFVLKSCPRKRPRQLLIVLVPVLDLDEIIYIH